MLRAGFVLTGGRSSRMGRNKALLPYAGTTLAAHLVGIVEQAAGSATMVGMAGVEPCPGRAALPDLYPGEGPLGGILTALAASPAEMNLIVACDMPALEAPFLAALLDQAGRSEGDCLVPISAGGRPEPLCAVYRASAHAGLERAFLAGIRAPRAALEFIRTVYHEIREGHYFSNVNTPEEWESHLRFTSGR